MSLQAFTTCRWAPLRPPAPFTPAMLVQRPRAMMWCGLGMIMLLANMIFKGRPTLAVMTILVVIQAMRLLYGFMHAQFLNDLEYWTADRISAWNEGERDMDRIAAISEQPLLELALPVPAEPLLPIAPASGCSADHDGERTAT